ncbi:hypothetical protein EON64_06485, partial [archaeon]
MARRGNGSYLQYALVPVLLAVIFPLWKTMQSSDPISFMLPNLLLFTQYREEARALWFKLVKVDTKIIREPSHVPVINAADYSFETLREATENWRYPAIVRGMFNGTPAIDRWTSPDYLPSVLGDFVVP